MENLDNGKEEIVQELFRRQVPQEYQESIKAGLEGNIFITSSEPYAETFLSKLRNPKNKGLLELFKDKISGEKVLDLGCGYGGIGHMISDGLGASMYIGVDLTPSIYYRDSGASSTQALAISDDILSAVSKIEDKTIGAIIVSGIETYGTYVKISKEERDSIIKYLEYLSKEIDRVLKPGGVVISHVGAVRVPKEFVTIMEGANAYDSISVGEKPR